MSKGNKNNCDCFLGVDVKKGEIKIKPATTKMKRESYFKDAITGTVYEKYTNMFITEKGYGMDGSIETKSDGTKFVNSDDMSVTIIKSLKGVKKDIKPKAFTFIRDELYEDGKLNEELLKYTTFKETTLEV